MDNEQEQREQAADQMRVLMMGLTDTVMPWREWLSGSVTYFQGQGFTDEQARAMAASEYVTALGGRIEPGATRDTD